MRTLALFAAALLVSPVFAGDLNITVEEKPHIRTNRESLKMLQQSAEDAVHQAVAERVYDMMPSGSVQNGQQDAAYWKGKYEQAMQAISTADRAITAYKAELAESNEAFYSLRDAVVAHAKGGEAQFQQFRKKVLAQLEKEAAEDAIAGK